MDNFIVCRDRTRKSNGLVVFRGKNSVKVIKMNLCSGIKLQKYTKNMFEDLFEQLPHFPVEKCAQLLGSYAKLLGADESSLKILSSYVDFTNEDKEKMLDIYTKLNY